MFDNDWGLPRRSCSFHFEIRLGLASGSHKYGAHLMFWKSVFSKGELVLAGRKVCQEKLSGDAALRAQNSDAGPIGRGHLDIFNCRRCGFVRDRAANPTCFGLSAGKMAAKDEGRENTYGSHGPQPVPWTHRLKSILLKSLL